MADDEDDHDHDSGDRRSRKRSSSENKKKKKKRRSDKSHRREGDDDGEDASITKKSKKHGDHHHQKRSKRSDRKERSTNERNLYDLGVIYSREPTKLLTSSDYFDFHKHLWLYLYRTKNLIFDELSSKETRRYFEEFRKEYNHGKLPLAYYETQLPRQAMEECPTTRHKWGFNVSKELDILQQTVYQQTEQEPQLLCTSQPPPSNTTRNPDSKPEVASTKQRPVVGPARPPPLSNAMDDVDPSTSRKRSRFDRAGDKPEKLDFNERRLLEKKQIGQRTHGAHRDRDSMELSDDAVYGGDASTEFRRALEQQKRRNASRLDRQAARVLELKEKEAAKQKEMLERLGLTKR